MKWFKDLKINYKLGIGFSIMIVFMGIIGYTGYSSTRNIHRNIDEIFNSRLPSINYLIKTGSDIQEIIAAERTMIFTNVQSDDFKELIKVYEQQLKESDELWQRYRALPATPEEAEIIPKYEKARQEWEVISRNVVEGRSSDTREGRRLAIDLTVGEAKKKFEEMKDYLDKLEKINSNIARMEHRSAANTYRRTIFIIFGVTAFGLLICICIVIILSRNIINRIKDNVEMLKDIAQGDGDLTKRLSADSKDELGELSSWFNMFVEKIQGIIRSISSNSDTLAASSEELSATTSELRRGADEQALHIEQSATTMNEMSQTIVDVAKNAAEASGSAKMASEIASEGKQVVEDSVESISKISRTVDVSASTINELGNSSKQIGEIITVIQDIADQTNLLALNAAIEAARAGEQGRGFAVVADEVRKLAERTGTATGEISEMIKKIQKDVDISVKSIEEGKTQVRDGVEQSEKAKESLDRIVATSKQCLDMVQMIAAATEEQSSAVEEVSATMESISKGSQSSKQSVSQIHESSNSLAKLAVELQGIVARFKIDNTAVINAASRSRYHMDGGPSPYSDAV